MAVVAGTGFLEKLVQRFLEGLSLTIGARADHGDKGVRHGEDAAGQQQVIFLESQRVSGHPKQIERKHL